MRSISRACRRGDQVGAFAAVHESESGTFETCPRYEMSSSRGRPEVISAGPERRDWTPKATWDFCPLSSTRFLDQAPLRPRVVTAKLDTTTNDNLRINNPR